VGGRLRSRLRWCLWSRSLPATLPRPGWRRIPGAWWGCFTFTTRQRLYCRAAAVSLAYLPRLICWAEPRARPL